MKRNSVDVVKEVIANQKLRVLVHEGNPPIRMLKMCLSDHELEAFGEALTAKGVFWWSYRKECGTNDIFFDEEMVDA
jgi:hypothetical protein